MKFCASKTDDVRIRPDRRTRSAMERSEKGESMNDPRTTIMMNENQEITPPAHLIVHENTKIGVYGLYRPPHHRGSHRITLHPLLRRQAGVGMFLPLVGIGTSPPLRHTVNHLQQTLVPMTGTNRRTLLLLRL